MIGSNWVVVNTIGVVINCAQGCGNLTKINDAKIRWVGNQAKNNDTQIRVGDDCARGDDDIIVISHNQIWNKY